MHGTYFLLKQLMEGGKGDLVSVAGSSTERILINRTNPDASLGDKRSEPDQPHPFLTDLNVRKALAMAIDRKAVAALYPPNAGFPTCEMITTQPYMDPAQIYGGRNKCEQDIEGAKKLLDDAGWKPGSDGIRAKNGVQLKILYITTVNPLRQQEQAHRGRVGDGDDQPVRPLLGHAHPIHDLPRRPAVGLHEVEESRHARVRRPLCLQQPAFQVLGRPSDQLFE